MNLGASPPRGVAALKDYLYYAEHGQLPSVTASTGEHASPFEAAVARALAARGWTVHAQVGTAGFAIDLAKSAQVDIPVTLVRAAGFESPL